MVVSACPSFVPVVGTIASGTQDEGENGLENGLKRCRYRWDAVLSP